VWCTLAQYLGTFRDEQSCIRNKVEAGYLSDYERVLFTVSERVSLNHSMSLEAVCQEISDILRRVIQCWQ
jgi:hypothetical protein